MFAFFFFFSSRRRHTRFDCDWSSDVCSSDLENLTLPQFLERAAAAHPDTIAVVFLNGRLRYRELKEQVDRLATALAALGVAKDQRVAIQLPNLPQTVIAYYATLRLGDRKSTRL